MEIKLVGHGLCRIMAETTSQIEPIRKYFRTENPTKYYIEYNMTGYSAADYVYGMSILGEFRIGLLHTVIKVLKKLNIEYTIDKHILRKYYPLKSMGIEIDEMTTIPCELRDEFEYREYQFEAPERCLKYGRGIILLPTASGKSFVITKTLISLLDSSDRIKHCLILVPTTILVGQFYKDLIDYGIDPERISMFSAKNSKTKKCQDTEIIISNKQWLNYHRDELPYIDAVFVDEVHEFAKGPKSIQMIESFKTDIKLACTGTLPNELMAKWTVIGLIGPVLYAKPAKEMIAENYISDLVVTSIHVKDPVIEKDTSCLFSLKRKVKSDDISLAYSLEKEYISNNIERLYRHAVEHIAFQSMGENTLYIFDNIKFGKELYGYIKSISSSPEFVFYIDGKIGINERETIRQEIEKCENAIIVAQSRCFSLGVNIRKLHNIVLVFNGTATTKVFQSIGRTLRKHATKRYACLYDINFNFKYSSKHHRDRRKLYKSEYGKDVSEIIRITL